MVISTVECLGKDKAISIARQCADKMYRTICTLENDEWRSLRDHNKRDFEVYNKLSSDDRRGWCMKRDFQFACKCVMLDALRELIENLESK